MDPNTGRIVKVMSEDQALVRGLIPVSAEELAELQAMTPEERRAWAKGKLGKGLGAASFNAKQHRAKRRREKNRKRNQKKGKR